jgi:hypothetical protein
MEYFGCLRMIDSVFSIILKLIQVWRFHFLGGEITPRGRIFLIEYSPIVLLKIKFLAIKKPLPPMQGSGVESRFGFPRAYYLRRRRIRAKPPRPRRAVDDGSGMGAASKTTPDETTLFE